MNKYAKSAIEATKRINKDSSKSPIDDWNEVTYEIFGEGSAQKKGCPKSAYLSLCEVGAIKGVPKGNYTKARENKKYTLNAYEYLKESKLSNYDIKELWKKATNNIEKKHNSQMNVVIELYKEDLLIF